MDKVLYLRNIKQGYATNSSSYHSTITRYIEIPESIWVQFKENNVSENVKTSAGGYAKGLVLRDDEGGSWATYEEIKYNSESDIIIRDLGLKDGESWIRIIFDTPEENDY